MTVWDKPVFKILANNDTGNAKGHQGGIVIPKDITPYFPSLRQNNSSVNPTSDIKILAELFLNGIFLEKVETRYQHQTWGGTRSPEHRLTDNLGSLRNKAQKDDIILFEKSLDEPTLMRISLIKKSSANFENVVRLADGRRWGNLFVDDPAISLVDLYTAATEMAKVAAEPPTIFETMRKSVSKRVETYARNAAFRDLILNDFNSKCAVTGRQFFTLGGSSGLDAAHIVPVNFGGSDHPVNGLALSKDIHWAFDVGLIGFTNEFRVTVPEKIRNMKGNEYLAALDNTELNVPNLRDVQQRKAAFQWHRDNVLVDAK